MSGTDNEELSQLFGQLRQRIRDPLFLSQPEQEHFSVVATEVDKGCIAAAEQAVLTAAQRSISLFKNSLIGGGLLRDFGHALASVMHMPLEGATYLEEAAQWFAGGADSAPPSRDNGNALSSSCLCASMQCMLEAAALRVRCDSLDTAMDTLTKAMGQSQTLLASSAAPLTWQSDLVSVVLPEQALLPPGCSVPAGTPTPDECPKADSQQTASRPPAAPVSVAVSILPDNSTAKLSDSFLSGTVVAPVHGVASASKLAGQFLAAPSPSPATDRTNCAPPAAPTAVNAASTPVTMAARVSTLTATSPAAIRGAPKAVVLQAAGADDEDPLSPRNNDTSPFDAPLSLLPKAPHHVAPTPPSPLSPMALSSCQPAVLSNPPKPTVSSSAAPTFVNVSLQSTNGKVHADGSGGDGSDRGGGTKGGSGEGPPDSSVVVGLLATSARATLVAPAWVREAVRIRVALSLLLVLCQIPAQARAVADQLSAGPLGAHGGACAAVAREALGAIIAAAEAGDLESMLRAQDAYSEAWEDGLAADLVQRIVERMLMI